MKRPRPMSHSQKYATNAPTGVEWCAAIQPSTYELNASSPRNEVPKIGDTTQAAARPNATAAGHSFASEGCSDDTASPFMKLAATSARKGARARATTKR